MHHCPHLCRNKWILCLSWNGNPRVACCTVFRKHYSYFPIYEYRSLTAPGKDQRLQTMHRDILEMNASHIELRVKG